MHGDLNVKVATRIDFTLITEHQKIKVSKVVHTTKLFHGKICGSQTFIWTYPSSRSLIRHDVPYIHVGRYSPFWVLPSLKRGASILLQLVSSILLCLGSSRHPYDTSSRLVLGFPTDFVCKISQWNPFFFPGSFVLPFVWRNTQVLLV